MAPQTRAAARASATKPLVTRGWRKQIRLTSPSISPDSDSESTTSTRSDPGFQGFMNLPIDVFVNIASYFQLQDLLTLTRVNSFLRRLLMSCKSKPIWQSARLNVIGLPPCPPKLSEPAYAAQLYTKICTSCGNRAIQHMDPVLLVRLCGKCKKSQLVDLAAEYDIDESLVFNSKTILPGYNSDFYTERGPWCFNEDLRLVKSALDAFDENGHEEAKQAWIGRRQEIVNAREESAEPLIEWFQDLEAEREAELDLRKQARKTEIKSRLQKLGYGKQDMDFENWGGWFSRVYNASPLTDKVWRELLPDLQKLIKSNRKERIESERADRRDEIDGWCWDICESKRFLWEKNYTELNATSILLENLEVIPEIKRLLHKDQPHAEFIRDFESQKPTLVDILTNWINEQEARLISMMPDDTSVPEFVFPKSKSVMLFVMADSYKAAPMDALPVNTQKLLRADAIFTHPLENTDTNRCYFYPSFNALPDGFTYSKLASEIARSFLNSLGRPDATYLEMMSEGHELGCGMCPEIQPLGWKDLIEHCLNEHWTEEMEEKQI